MAVETIWDYLDLHGIDHHPRKGNKIVQLAKDIGNLNNAEKSRMTDEWMIFEKLDGVYSFITVMYLGGRWEARHWGRTGKALSGCEDLDRDISESFAHAGVRHSVVLISEITSEGPLAKLSGYLNPNRKSEKEAPNGIFDNFHDMLSLAEFIEGEADRNAWMRHRTLLSTLQEVGLDDQAIGCTTGDLDMGKEFARMVMEDGGEGAILRNPKANWVAGKRDERQIKVKEQIDFECEVVGIASGKFGSKYEHTTGKLLVAFRAFGQVDGALILLPVGSGLTDQQRDEIYQNPQGFIGAIVKVKAKSFTEFGNLREPVIEEIRYDKKQADFKFKRGRVLKDYICQQSRYLHYEIN